MCQTHHTFELSSHCVNQILCAAVPMARVLAPHPVDDADTDAGEDLGGPPPVCLLGSPATETAFCECPVCRECDSQRRLWKVRFLVMRYIRAEVPIPEVLKQLLDEVRDPLQVHTLSDYQFGLRLRASKLTLNELLGTGAAFC